MNAFLLAVLCLCPAPPNPECARLIAAMGSTDWEVRDTASQAAMKLDARCFRHLEIAAGHHADPEVRRRCRAVADRLVEAEVARLGPVPWITTYGFSSLLIPERHNPYLKIACEMLGFFCGPPYPQYTYATVLYCRDQVRVRLWLGLSLEPLKAEVAGMRQAEDAWKRPMATK